MRVFQETAGLEYILEFSNAEEYESFFQEVESSGSFVVGGLDLPEQATFRARAAGSQRSRKLKPFRISKEDAAYRIFIHSNKADVQQPVPSAPPSEPPVTEEEAQKGRSLFERIRLLPVSERVTLAMTADWRERRVLMQENNSKIHEFLLRNPRITEEEIAWLARNPGSPIQTLLAIGSNKPWMSVEQIRSALMLNPRTPAPLVMGHIPKLGEAELVKMFHSPYLRPDIKAAVTREIKNRGIRIRN